MAKFAFGLKSVKFGDPTGTVAMPETLTDFAKTVKGSMTLEESEATEEKFYVEEQSAPVESVITEDSELEATWECYDIAPEILAIVKGGTTTTSATEKTWSAPSSAVRIKKAIQLTTESGAKITIPNATITARITGKVGKEELLKLSVKATPLDPGDGGSPFQIITPI